MRLSLALLLALLLTAPSLAQTLSTPAPDALTPAQRADRDTLLKPALDMLRANKPAEAYAAFGPALMKYPTDVIVLRDSGFAALESAQYQPAADLLTRALAQHPADPWPLLTLRMEALANLALWGDFDRDLELLRTAKKSGTDPNLANSTGFEVDRFVVNGETVTTIFFPTMASHYHTLYRFFLPRSTTNTATAQAATNTPGTADACKNPDFQPYIDLESDDVDQGIFQKSHPDLAAKGGREYSLDTYPAPCSQGLIRFYDGEPSYETLRADLIKTLTKKK